HARAVPGAPGAGAARQRARLRLDHQGHALQQRAVAGAQQLPFLSRVMAEAPHLRLNFGLILLSLHKPLDVAEQIATVDVMSGGKVIFGVALGYRDVEFLAFGTTQKERVKRLEENLDAIRRLWTEDTVDMVGSHFTLLGASSSPRPLQKPHPPVWIGANADPAIRRAARLGDCWYVNPHNRIETIVRQAEVYKRALDEYRKPFPTEFPARREVFVARSRSEAIRLCAPFLAAKYKAYHEWGQDRAMPKGDNDLGAGFDDLIRDRFLLGSPDEVAEQMLALNRATGINHLIMSVQWPGMPQSLALDELHMLAEEVFPRVRQGYPGRAPSNQEDVMPKKEIVQVNPAAANPNLSPATKFGNLVFVSGQTGRHPITGVVGKDIREQTRNVVERIKTIVAAAGTSLDNVLTVTRHLAMREEVAAYNEEYAKYFPANKPARTTVSAALNSPELLVEITVTACIPS